MIGKSKPSISFVIPCLNEVAAVSPVLQRVISVTSQPNFLECFSSCEIIVVDDGSTDGSIDKVSEFKSVKLIRHQANLGYGAALKTGFKLSTGDFITFLDMDASYDPDSIISLYSALKDDNLDMIFGCRFQPSSKMPFVRKIGNLAFTWILRQLFTTSITDVCTGFRVFKKSLVPQITAIDEKGLNFSIALTLLAMKDNWRIDQRYIPYLEREGRSKLNVVKDGFAFASVIFRKSKA